jgi:hypothetical protein
MQAQRFGQHTSKQDIDLRGADTANRSACAAGGEPSGIGSTSILPPVHRLDEPNAVPQKLIAWPACHEEN